MSLMVWYVTGKTVAALVVVGALAKVLDLELPVRYPALAGGIGAVIGTIALAANPYASETAFAGIALMVIVSLLTVCALAVLAWWAPQDHGLRVAVRRRLHGFIGAMR